MYQFELLDMKLKEKLNESRYKHSVNVMETAIELAEIYDVDQDKAKIAGLLHDYAKFLSHEQIHDYIRLFNLKYDKFLLKNSYLLHGPVGAEIIKLEFNIYDKEILDAIKHHTYGCKNMSKLDKIIYVADIIEPGRDQFPGLDELRKKVYEDLDEGLKYAVKTTLQYLTDKNMPIYDKTVELWNSLVE